MQTTLARGFAALLTILGTGAVLAPKPSSGQFGIPADSAAALAYVRSTGVRDLALGAIVLASLGDRAALKRVLLWGSFVGLADAAIVFAERGLRPQHAGHLGGFAAMLLTALSIDGDGPAPGRND